MKNIRLKIDYKHQGVLMSRKLVYGVPGNVADGMVDLGIADMSVEDADLTLDHLTWAPSTALYGEIKPDSMVQAHD